MAEPAPQKVIARQAAAIATGSLVSGDCEIEITARAQITL